MTLTISRLCRIMTTKARLFAATFALTFATTGVSATTPSASPTTTLTFAQALKRAESGNAALQEYPFYIRAADAMSVQASIKPLPVVSTMIENVMGTGQTSGINSADITLTLSQTLEMGDKQAKRVKFADAKKQRLHTEYQLTKLDALAETGRRYYRVLALQASMSLMEKRIASEQKALGIITQRANAGAVGDADKTLMALQLADSKTKLQTLTLNHQLALKQLAAMWLMDADFDQVSGDLSTLPPLPDEAHVKSALQHSPAVLDQLALQRINDQQLQLEIANGHQNITVGLGVRRLQATSDQGLVLSASMPLAFENPNRGRIAAAKASFELSHQQILNTKRQLQTRLIAIQQQMMNASAQLSTLRNKLIPLADTLVSDTTAGYKSGLYSVLRLADAQAKRFALEQTAIDLHTQLFTHFLELERITGQSFSTLSSADPTVSGQE